MQIGDAGRVGELGSVVGSSGEYSASTFENPWGCYGQTDYPHATDSEGPWVVNVHARTECPGKFRVPKLWVETQLYRETHCVFSICFGIEPRGEVASDTAYNAYLV